MLQRYTPLFLVLLNLLISWRLVKVEYTSHFDTVEPFFYALADFIRIHWFDSGWWPFWNCGMPFRYTYQPLLHFAVASLASVTGFSTAHAFHVCLALFYSAGPVTLFVLTQRLSRSYIAAFTAALLYSLWSPSAWLMPDIAADVGGLFHAQRLHTAVAYGDAPYVSGLTLIPIAVFLIDRTIERPTIVRILFAALGCIAVPLTNIPAAISLAMVLGSYCLAAPWKGMLSRCAWTICLNLLGYLLVAPMMPLSGIFLTARNTQWMDSTGAITETRTVVILVGVLVLFGLSRALFVVTRLEFTRFSVLFLLITSIVVLGNDWGGFSIIAQAKRFHLVLEMAVVLFVGALVQLGPELKSRARFIAVVAVIALVVMETVEYRSFARELIRPAKLEGRSETKIAKWLSHNSDGARVMVPGSVSFWLNALTTTPQADGCCDQNLLFQAPRIDKYLMGTDDGTRDRAAEMSILWLKTLGVRFVAVCGPKSTETFHVTHHPNKFDGILTQRWHEGDDSIFEVQGNSSSSLAHWIKPTDAISRMPVNGIDVDPLRKYVTSIDSAERRLASLTWDGTDTVVIKGEAMPKDLLSIQIPFHAGWGARDSSGQKLVVGQDALGFMLLDTRCAGTCSVILKFDGGIENRILCILQASAWLAFVACLLFLKRNSLTAWTTSD